MLFWSFLAAAIGILIRFIVVPSIYLFRIGNTISREAASEIIGEHFEEVKDKLTNTLQLRAMRAEANELERALINASLTARSQELEHVQFVEAIKLNCHR